MTKLGKTVVVYVSALAQYMFKNENNSALLTFVWLRNYQNTRIVVQNKCSIRQ